MTDRKVYAVIDYEDNYVQPLLLKVLQRKFADNLVMIKDITELPTPDSAVLQWRQYESIDFDHLMTSSRMNLANSYIIRKALIRKHYLSNTISHWLSKHRESVLKDHVKPSIDFEVDYAEFLDDALLEAYELHDSWRRNLEAKDEEKQWWILKPGMSDKGQGIRLLSSEEELTAIFEEWDPESDDEDDEVVPSDDEALEGPAATAIRTSHLRHFVVQPYIHPPLLFPAPHPSAGRKFHIRTYVLAVGALKVYVYRPMLALFAAELYTAPSSSSANDNLNAHLTNTCLQASAQRAGVVHAFWDLPSGLDSLPTGLQRNWQDHVWTQICAITADLFEAAARTSAIHFQPLPNAFEIFGLDFLVDAGGCAWLLEVNAFPDFAQTGDELSGMIETLIAGVVDTAVAPFFGHDLSREEHSSDLVKVLDLDLGRR